jgi:hypothetical protein
VPLKYLHGGGVWIPAEARCGGSYPVVVLLHGNNTSKETVKSLGPGPESRRFDQIARKYLGGKLISPVILAEPIHFAACANDAGRKGLEYLFAGSFDFATYRKLLEESLRKQGIRARSWSFIGHSGAACCLQMGMFAVKKVWPEIKVWASADGCYSGDGQAATVLEQFGTSRTKVINACRGVGAYPGYKAYERTLLGASATKVPCDGKYYQTCKRHPQKPYYSYVTQFAGSEKHSQVLIELFKTVLYHDFPSARRVELAKAAEARRRRLATLARSRPKRAPAASARPRPRSRTFAERDPQ